MNTTSTQTKPERPSVGAVIETITVSLEDLEATQQSLLDALAPVLSPEDQTKPGSDIPHRLGSSSIIRELFDINICVQQLSISLTSLLSRLEL